jgi:hypothetical protein
MMWVLSTAGVVTGLFALLLVWGLLRIRQGARAAVAEAQKLSLSDVAPLAREWMDVFRHKLGIHLDPDDCDGAAARLDEAFRTPDRLKTAFARNDLPWYFALPVGACLGELLRRHARHEWRKLPGEAAYLVLRLADGEFEAYPFEKAVKQAQIGGAGDLVAYVIAARALAEGSASR